MLGPRSSHFIIAPLVLAAAWTAGPEGVAAAAPASDCPSGYDRMYEPALTAQGYLVPQQVDDPNSGVKSFGRPGNGDDWVCGHLLGNQTTSFDPALPIYNFWDNNLSSR